MLRKRIISYFNIILGTAITAFAINAFLVPNKIVAGGASGIATILYITIKVPMSVTVILINIPLMIMAFYFLGESLGYRAIFGSLVLSLMLELTKNTPCITYDLLLATIAGGAVMGLGLGIVFVNGSSTGGTDISAKLLNKWFPFISIAKFLLISDLLIVLSSGFIFESFDIVIYASIGLVISSYIIDSIESGIDFAKAAFIISDYPQEISDAIITKINRSATGFYGKGMFKNSDKMILMCVIKGYEIAKLKKIVKANDENAFVILTDIKEVLGEGFKNNLA